MMRLSRISRLLAEGQSGKGPIWCLLALPSVLLVCGCGRSVDSEVASAGVENSATPADLDEVVVEETTADSRMDLNETEVEEAKIEQEPLDEPPAKLSIGDSNPGLQIAKWIKGSPVEEPLKEKVHVVEFWATWCGPCRAGMPHISELQNEYGDEVAFMGITREDEGTVTKFLESESPDGRTWDEVIEYRLALDDRDWTNSAYMRAAGRNGIPCAFVVGRDGVVEWIGHPAGIDEPLKQIVEGNWDREAAKAELQQQERLSEISSQLTKLARAADWDGALKLLDQLEEETGKSTGLLQYRLRVLDSAGRSSEASTVRAELVEQAWDDASMLNEIAWTTATTDDSPDLEIALKAGERASELRGNQDPAVLDTVARCYFELGKIEEAIRWQRLAVEHNNGYPEINNTLEKYLAAKSSSEQKEESEKPNSDETESEKEAAE